MTDTTVRVPQDIVRLSRRFEASPEEVFRAWTDPVEVASWYGPDGWYAPEERTRIDDAVGGRWEVTMIRRSDGFEFPIGYEILELDEPSLIVLRHTENDPGGDTATLVRVELFPDGDGTLMTLTDGPMPAEGAELAKSGYAQSFEKLATRLGGSQRVD